ncbi:MAG: tRNA glutamyl-Q(34) synthetase GluQRS [Planctomycetes bacterium]|nr:tRNA glutamyl-Q(34) synthetase GluQRS [Planctomycetota bacterium]MCB9934136.1 tRNA glutamyl-Q(34) synthetase GluQRS [Planctomycetota bacterium]
MSRPAVGRLAPTPSGWLHLGNARTFLLAWLWVRSCHGRVIMRIEDIDRPRCKPELREAALSELAWLGLDWDVGPHAGDPPGEYDQGTRFEVYRRCLQKLADAGLAYPCTCTRKDIEQASSAPHGDEGAIYPGTCRGRWDSYEHAKRESGIEPAWRFRFEGASIHFLDDVSGDVSIDRSTLGDFVLWRRDDLPSYQLAVTVDDALMGVTQVLRGRDLLTSTARQLALYAALGLQAPAQWAHVPFVQDAQGRRMAKRDGDLSLNHLRETGVDPSRVVGLLAWSAGLLADLQPAAPRELVGDFSLQRIGKEDFVVTEEHLTWLHK